MGGDLLTTLNPYFGKNGRMDNIPFNSLGRGNLSYVAAVLKKG